MQRNEPSLPQSLRARGGNPLKHRLKSVNSKRCDLRFGAKSSVFSLVFGHSLFFSLCEAFLPSFWSVFPFFSRDLRIQILGFFGAFPCLSLKNKETKDRVVVETDLQWHGPSCELVGRVSQVNDPHCWCLA